jgi:hypothetical protein
MDYPLSQFADIALRSLVYVDRYSSEDSGRRPYRRGKYSETRRMPRKWRLASRSAKRLTGAFTLLTNVSASAPARAPHTSNDPVASAEDALGLTLGLGVDVMFAPIATRSQTYGVRVDGPAKDYMDRRLRPPLIAEWLRLGEEETDFILSLEVGVASISNAGI